MIKIKNKLDVAKYTNWVSSLYQKKIFVLTRIWGYIVTFVFITTKKVVSVLHSFCFLFSFLRDVMSHKIRQSFVYFLLCSVVLFLTYPSLRLVKIDETLLSINGIGGFGDIIKKEQPDIDSNIIHQLQEDEHVKDTLLGVNTNIDDIVADAPKKIEYKVKAGDTLSHISKRFNISVDSIMSSTNGIVKIHSLKIGQTLRIPPKDGFYYKVKKNDRLASVALAHSVAFKSLIASNPNIDPDLLEPNMEIFLPGAKKPKVLPSGWLVPVSSRIVTSGFGPRAWPRRAFHKGLDLKASFVPVKSARSGQVIYANWLGGYGNAVIVAHPDGYKTLYAHLSKIYVKADSKVIQGQLLAKSGDTGYSFGPHLHFEVSYNGKNENPTKFLKGLSYQK